MTGRFNRAAPENPAGGSTGRSRTLVGFFMRSCGNLHYFASIKPYLDALLLWPGLECKVIVTGPVPDVSDVEELAAYKHLFTADLTVDDCDIVLTPTFLRPDDRPSRRSSTRVVQIFHGMSDKPFTYERDFSDYALCLCAGQRQVDRLLSFDHNRNVRWSIVGYPKFDRFPSQPPLVRNTRKTIVYSPTWRKGGISSIEHFLENWEAIAPLTGRYNLIVKPHPNLFNPSRPFFDRSIVERLEALPGIHLVRSGNVMPWFAQADLFLGDISAAGYEWLYFNRPMVFLNPQPNHLRPSNDMHALTYLWQCGAVCDDPRNLGMLVDAALESDPHAATREAVLSYSVYRPRDGRALERGLAALGELLNPAGNLEVRCA